jgi:integrase
MHSPVSSRGSRSPASSRRDSASCGRNLRHSCLTNLAAAGVPDSTARAISGHKTESAHRRYVITQPAAKAAALAAMANLIEQARNA